MISTFKIILQKYLKQKVVGNMIWLFFDNFFRFGSNFCILIFMARHLGPSNFGLYTYVLAFIALFDIIAAIGLDLIVLRDLVNRPKEKCAILGTAFILKFIFGIVAFCLAFLCIIMIKPINAILYWMIGIMSFGFIFNAANTIDYWFQSQIESKYAVLARNIILPVIVLIKIALIMYHISLIFFCVINLLEMAISAILLFVFYQRKEGLISEWQFQKSRAFQLLHDAWPLVISGFALIIYMRIDQIIIHRLLNTEQLGFYSAALRISELWYFIPMIIIPSLFPLLLKIKNRDAALYFQKLQRLYTLLTWGLILCSLIITFFSKWIIGIIYGSQYIIAHTVLSIHIWTSLLLFWELLISRDLLADNLTKITLLRTLLGSIANIGFNFLLIPIFGITGSAIATLMAYGLSILSVGFVPSKRMHIRLIMHALLLKKAL